LCFDDSQPFQFRIDAMKITLRPATPDDEPFLYELFRTTYTEGLPTQNMDATQREFLTRMQFNAQQQTYSAQFPEADHDMILLDGCPVGRVLVERKSEEIRGVDIALLAEHRSAGIGTLVIQNLLAEAQKAGKPFRIQVIKSNRAARLYERLGLWKTGESSSHFSMEWDANK
jgi:ribosomal protein S18 acetylase RimI-like enzyme